MDNAEIKKPIKLQKPIERATISDSLKEKLVNLTAQANKMLQGIATVTRSDVINLILQDHAAELSSPEIEQLKRTHIDQVKLALWLADEVKNAKRMGEQVSLKELIERCESIVPKKAKRRPRKKKSVGEHQMTASADPLNESPVKL